jgi:phosphoglycolate phosphatase-like HAD superfamily hydrolase
MANKEIKKMLIKKPNAIIFDIDGVLSDPSRRIEFAKNKDWDSFNGLASADYPFKEVCSICRSLSKDFKIVFLTGRPKKYFSQTVKWLHENVFLLQQTTMHLVMRPTDDFRKSSEFKLSELNKLKEQYTIVAAFDDNEDVVKMYKEQGVKIFALQSMYED